MPVLLTSFSSALRTVLLPYIRDNFNTQTILSDQIKRNNGVQFMNNNFYAPIRTSRHGGVVNLANDGNTLVSSSAATGQASVGVKVVTGTFDISKLAMDATSTEKGAVESALKFQAESLSDDFVKDVNRQYFSDGVGVIAEVATSGSVGVGTIAVQYPTSSLDDGRSINWYGTVNADLAPTEYIFPGMALGIGTAGADVGTVTSVTYTAGDATGTVIVTGGPAVANNDAIYKVDGSEQGAGTSEIQGIRLALSSGTANYAGVARSVQGWAPQIGTASGALTLSDMENVYLAAKKFAKTGDRYAIFMNKTLYKKYGDILTSMRRQVNETELLGGWSGLEFAAGAGRVGVFLDYDTPDGEVEIVNLDSWTVCQVRDMEWAENPDGGGLIRTRSAITYQATMVWFTNLLCLAPGANGRLTQKTA